MCVCVSECVCECVCVGGGGGEQVKLVKELLFYVLYY